MLIKENLNSKNIKLVLVSLLIGVVVVLNFYIIKKAIFHPSGQVEQDERMERIDRNVMIYQ
mgnify:CR=1 FL=1